ncbi:MAG: hypothetical protein HQM11_05405 [SAR324 cluster bacterium]|nr:hypothetical protein [SAR324 cluster bacterium]
MGTVLLKWKTSGADFLAVQQIFGSRPISVILRVCQAGRGLVVDSRAGFQSTDRKTPDIRPQGSSDQESESLSFPAGSNTKKQIASLMDFSFLEHRHNVIFIGPPGE